MIRRALLRFDSWVEKGPFTPAGLSLFRIIYSIIVLINLPTAHQFSSLPPAAFEPPPGIFQLLAGYPPGYVIIGIEIFLALSLSSLAVGFYTRTSSVAAGLSYIAISGLSFSFGKIDHTILESTLPLVLAWSGWGAHYSVDSRRETKRRPSVGGPQWPMRFLAFTIGVAFMFAALGKIMGGWLKLGDQRTQDFFIAQTSSANGRGLMDPFFAGIKSPIAWEFLDWATVALEFGILISVLWWPVFRWMLIVAVAFHLGVFVMLGIVFKSNINVYGAFIPWEVVILAVLNWYRRRGWSTPVVPTPVLLIAVPVLAVLSWTVATFGWTKNYVQITIVLVGAVVAVACSVVGLISILKRTSVVAERPHA